MKKNTAEEMGVVLVDDCPLVGVGFASLFQERDKSLRVCAVTNNISATIEEIERWNPKLLILEIGLEHASGNDVLLEVKKAFPALPVLVFTRYGEHPHAMRVLQAGAAGFLSKDAEVDEIALAVDTILRGEPYASHSVVKRMFDFVVGQRECRGITPPDILSQAEFWVFTRIGQGKTSREIADERQLSIKTVETHKANIKKKLQLKKAAELVHTAASWYQKN